MMSFNSSRAKGGSRSGGSSSNSSSSSRAFIKYSQPGSFTGGGTVNSTGTSTGISSSSGSSGGGGGSSSPPPPPPPPPSGYAVGQGTITKTASITGVTKQSTPSTPVQNTPYNIVSKRQGVSSAGIITTPNKNAGFVRPSNTNVGGVQTRDVQSTPGIYRGKDTVTVVSQGSGTYTPTQGRLKGRDVIIQEGGSGRNALALGGTEYKYQYITPTEKGKTISGFNLFNPETRTSLSTAASSGGFKTTGDIYLRAQGEQLASMNRPVATAPIVQKAPTTIDYFKTGGRILYESNPFIIAPKLIMKGIETSDQYISYGAKKYVPGVQKVYDYSSSPQQFFINLQGAARYQSVKNTGNFTVLGIPTPVNSSPLNSVRSKGAEGIAYGLGKVSEFGGVIVRDTIDKPVTQASIYVASYGVGKIVAGAETTYLTSLSKKYGAKGWAYADKARTGLNVGKSVAGGALLSTELYFNGTKNAATIFYGGLGFGAGYKSGTSSLKTTYDFRSGKPTAISRADYPSGTTKITSIGTEQRGRLFVQRYGTEKSIVANRESFNFGESYVGAKRIDIAGIEQTSFNGAKFTRMTNLPPKSVGAFSFEGRSVLTRPTSGMLESLGQSERLTLFARNPSGGGSGIIATTKLSKSYPEFKGGEKILSVPSQYQSPSRYGSSPYVVEEPNIYATAATRSSDTMRTFSTKGISFSVSKQGVIGDVQPFTSKSFGTSESFRVGSVKGDFYTTKGYASTSKGVGDTGQLMVLPKGEMSPFLNRAIELQKTGYFVPQEKALVRINYVPNTPQEGKTFRFGEKPFDRPFDASILGEQPRSFSTKGVTTIRPSEQSFATFNQKLGTQYGRGGQVSILQEPSTIAQKLSSTLTGRTTRDITSFGQGTGLLGGIKGSVGLGRSPVLFPLVISGGEQASVSRLRVMSVPRVTTLPVSGQRGVLKVQQFSVQRQETTPSLVTGQRSGSRLITDTIPDVIPPVTPTGTDIPPIVPIGGGGGFDLPDFGGQRFGAKKKGRPTPKQKAVYNISLKAQLLNISTGGSRQENKEAIRASVSGVTTRPYLDGEKISRKEALKSPKGVFSGKARRQYYSLKSGTFNSLV